ncbi:hypothetical protein [Vibrio echinoideorum]|uniref:hypothetical protein n=1 Tax=Vibrio echinoideorum TaxID=2100116 RepID=UPI0010811511|nr:hypothetical protein [Vibrio echinoideorum]
MDNTHNTSLSKGVAQVDEILSLAAKGMTDFINENQQEIQDFVKYLENFEEINSSIWQSAAESGWFPNDFTPCDFQDFVLEGQDSLDSYMTVQISESIEDIHKQLVDLYPLRKDILDVAFSLHNDGNYIASIPLFLAQTDGLCAQTVGSYLFAERNKRIDRIKVLIEKKPERAIILSPLLQDTEFGARIGKGKQVDKDKAPNRNGILHGSRKYLDYGTEINSLKCISLLSYLATTLIDIK